MTERERLLAERFAPLRKIPFSVYLILFAALLFFPFLGRTHLFDWDEINFAEAAREMLMSGDYSRIQINFHPFWEKPPLFIWMQAGSMHIFGIGEYAARFPNAVCGVFSVLFLYYMGKKWKGAEFAKYWSLLYLASFLPHLYFKSGIIDPWFNLFIFAGIAFYHELLQSTESGTKSRQGFYAFLSGLFIGLAVLTKGPVALILYFLVIFSHTLVSRFRTMPGIPALIILTLSLTLASTSWFAYDILKNGPWFIHEFIQYQIRLFRTQDAGHGGPFYYHFVIVLIGCFPASIFALFAWKDQEGKPSEKTLAALMTCLMLVVLVIFSIVKTKIVHYSSLSYFPLSFLAASGLYKWIEKDKKIPISVVYFTLSFLLFWSLLFFMLPLVGMHPEWIHPLLVRDPFAAGNLEAIVKWSYADIWPGLFLLSAIPLFIISKKSLGLSFAVILFLLICALSINGVVNTITPKIERYSQGAVIDFYKEKAGERAIVEVYGFKSYAHYFYGERKAGKNPVSFDDAMNREWNSPVYIIAKAGKKNKPPGDYHLQQIGEKNGFIFYKKTGN